MAKRKLASAQDALDGLQLSQQQRKELLNTIGLIRAADGAFGGKKAPVIGAANRKKVDRAIRSLKSVRNEIEAVQRDTHFLIHEPLAGDGGFAGLRANAQVEAVLKDLPAVNLPYALTVIASRLEAAHARAKQVNVVDARRMWIAELVDQLRKIKGRPCYGEAASFVSLATGEVWTTRDVQACWANRRKDKQTPRK